MLSTNNKESVQLTVVKVYKILAEFRPYMALYLHQDLAAQVPIFTGLIIRPLTLERALVLMGRDGM
jgi:hypothetical protein